MSELHTPWREGAIDVYDINGRPLTGEVTTEEQRRLIGLAPDLLKALRELITKCDEESWCSAEQLLYALRDIEFSNE